MTGESLRTPSWGVRAAAGLAVVLTAAGLTALAGTSVLPYASPSIDPPPGFVVHPTQVASAAAPAPPEFPGPRDAAVPQAAIASLDPVLPVPPEREDAETFVSPDGRIAVHYSIDPGSVHAVPPGDGDTSGVPDYVEAVAAGLLSSLRSAERDGFRALDPPGGRLDVHVGRLPVLGGGLVARTPPRADRFGAASEPGLLVLVDNRIASIDGAAAVAAKQAARAVLLSYGRALPEWWREATASWIETRARRSIGRYEAEIESALARPETGLASSTPAAGLLWIGFLVESSVDGPDVLTSVWEEAAATGSADVLELTDRALRARGRTLEAAYSEFAAWLIFTGQRDDEMHLSFAGEMPDVRFSATHREYPVTAIPADRRIAPLGRSLVQFEPDGEGGGLHLTFEGSPEGVWQADLLVADPRNPRRFFRAALPVDATGRATLSLPWNGSAEALLMVRNLRRDGPPAEFSYAARPARAFPYELGSFFAEPEGEGVRLLWETDSEEGLAAWEVYRSEARGPFRRVTGVAIPAVGGPDGPVSYQFVDRETRPATTYRYYVVGLTDSGLTRRTFTVTTRTAR